MNCANSLPEWNEIVATAERRVRRERIEELVGQVEEAKRELRLISGLKGEVIELYFRNWDDPATAIADEIERREDDRK